MPHPKFSMQNFRRSPTHIPNIIKVGHMVFEKCSRQKGMDGWMGAWVHSIQTFWIAKSLPELSSGETKMIDGA